MAILTASNLGQSFGSLDLFTNLSLRIPNDAKIGLVGPNGIGKTSLLLLLAGLTQPSAGTVHRARGKRLGYLPQESAQAFSGQDQTVYEEMLSIFADLRTDEARLRRMEAAMAKSDPSDELLERYGAALEEFELAGGYDYEVRIKQVLQGLGFAGPDWESVISHLSGGQKTRLLLARLLLEQPDLLMLDEPTNHLDVGAIEWLESTLSVWDGAILLVSHDRYFLDKVSNTIWEMNLEGVDLYRGNYSSYVRQRQERWVQRQQAYVAQKERLKKELDFVRRNMAGRGSEMAKGRLSRISREIDAIERGGRDAAYGKKWSQVSDSLGGVSRRTMSVAEAAEAIKRLQTTPGSTDTFDVAMKSSRRSGYIVLRTIGLEIGFPGKPLFKSEDIELHRLECAALIGPNGTGKTTFLRTVLGELEPLAGQFQLGASLDIAYFSQAHEALNPANAVIEELMEHHGKSISEARNYLARFLFQGDDVYKPISALSGGERGRLALAMMAMEGANLLLLDEPTNHLDIPAQEVLQKALEAFDGTILLVTHDRYLVDRLATQIWFLEEGWLRVFKGDYQAYVEERDRAAEIAKEATAERRAAVKRGTRQARAEENANRKQAERLAMVEREINNVEASLRRLSGRLQEATEASAFDKIQSLSIEYAAAESRLEELMNAWEKLAHEQALAG